MSEAPAVYDILSLVRTRAKAGSRFTLQVPRFRVAAGEVVAVMGSSGCGKSTLMDMLGLILPPTSCERFDFRSGSGSVLGVTPRTGARALADLRRSDIGYVLQHGALLPFLSVRQNALLPQQMAGIRDPLTVRHLLERLGIGDQAGKLPQHLSGGQRQRAAIARALAVQPPVILCDEPTAAVDEITAREIMAQLTGLSRAFGSTLIIVTHNLEIVRGCADRWFTFSLERPSSAEIVSTCHECDAPA